MPRVSRSLIRLAFNHSPLLPPLLRATNGLEQAKQELRWIQQELPKHRWINAISRRSKLEPLQYILGSQPFGSLDILCEPGVLIPRWETEEWVSKLADVISKSKAKMDNAPLAILDACTGSGCIPLLLQHNLFELAKLSSHMTAFDLSDFAYNLATKNLAHYQKTFTKQSFDIKRGDLFDNGILQSLKVTNLDLITSNPPYIPFSDYHAPTVLAGVEKSVRLYEPQMALVGNLEFYSALIKNLVIPSSCKAFVFEVGYKEQVEHTCNVLRELDTQWKTGSFTDSAGNIRAVIGWKNNTAMGCLADMCNNGPLN